MMSLRPAIFYLFLFLLSSNLWAAQEWVLYKDKHHPGEACYPQMRAAYEAMDRGKADRAGKIFERAHEEYNCSDPLTFYTLAQINELQKDYAKALKNYQRAREEMSSVYPRLPINKAIWEHIGRTYYLMGDYAQAIGAYSKLSRKQFQSSSSYFMLGDAFIQKKKYASGLQLLKDYARKQPSNADIRYYIGLTYYQKLKNYGQARYWTQRTLEIKPLHRQAKQLWDVLQQSRRDSHLSTFEQEVLDELGP